MEARDTPVSTIKWLNEQTKAREQVWLLALFRFMLKYIEKQGSVELDEDGLIRREAWLDIEQMLHYQLLHDKKTADVHLYRLFQHVSLLEGWVLLRNNELKVTDEGTLFLKKREPEQLTKILHYFFFQGHNEAPF